MTAVIHQLEEASSMQKMLMDASKALQAGVSQKNLSLVKPKIKELAAKIA